MSGWLGPNPAETVIQAISALATTAAAVFAALSARSSATSAKEMEEARQLATAPVIAVDVVASEFDIVVAPGTGRVWGICYVPDRQHVRPGFRLENHGNGAALNVTVEYIFPPPTETSDDEIVIARHRETSGVVIGLVQRGRAIQHETEFQTSDLPMESVGRRYFPSIGKGEEVEIAISEPVLACLLHRAVLWNKSGRVEQRCEVDVLVHYDTTLRRALTSRYKLGICGKAFASLGDARDAFHGNPTYDFTVEPLPPGA